MEFSHCFLFSKMIYGHLKTEISHLLVLWKNAMKIILANKNLIVKK